jgi:hypothetical protein
LVLEFTSAPIIAVNCASKLSHALSTRGLGAQRVSINQSMEQRGGEDVGVVEINLDDVASRGLNSRAGAKSTHAAPRPKFNLGDKVAIMDGGRVLDTGVIDYAYGYDDFQETYKYKVSTESGARKTWNEGSLKKMSRAGAKAAFAHPSWSAGILGKETAPQLAAYSWIDAHLGINGHRTQMLLADIAAEVHARNPALSIQQAIMKAAQEMVQKGVATYDIRALVEDKGWMSRAGAKSNGLTLAQRIAVEHDAKRMANR